MKAFISISYKQRALLKNVIESLKNTLNEFEVEPFVFVDAFNFPSDKEKEMMDESFRQIEQCELFIAEVSEKAVGVGVETGYAKGKNKKIIYVRNNKAEHSTTIAGSSDFSIIYIDVIDLKNKLAEVLKGIMEERLNLI